jgi:hypothetical protein
LHTDLIDVSIATHHGRIVTRKAIDIHSWAPSGAMSSTPGK